MRLPRPKHVQNTTVKPSWGQLWRETRCMIFGHMNCVPSWGAYPGLPQSHCYRCGKKNRMAIASCADWVDPRE